MNQENKKLGRGLSSLLSPINSNTNIENVTIYDNVEIGENCRIDSGTVIGSDGFGTINVNNKLRRRASII